MRFRSLRRITKDGLFKQNLCWSPNGEQILFAQNRAGAFNLCVVQTDGTQFRQVTETPPDKAPRYHPDWSSDGKKIVYVAFTFKGTDGFLHIHTIQPDGKNDTRIITGPQFNQQPVWSPDGKTVGLHLYTRRQAENLPC